MLPAQPPEPGSPMDKFQTIMKVLLKVPKAELDAKLAGKLPTANSGAAIKVRTKKNKKQA